MGELDYDKQLNTITVTSLTITMRLINTKTDSCPWPWTIWWNFSCVDQNCREELQLIVILKKQKQNDKLRLWGVFLDNLGLSWLAPFLEKDQLSLLRSLLVFSLQIFGREGIPVRIYLTWRFQPNFLVPANFRGSKTTFQFTFLNVKGLIHIQK